MPPNAEVPDDADFAAEAEASRTAGESDAVYDDLLTFLASPRADLRLAAVEAVLAALVSTSADDDGDNNGAVTTTNDDVARNLTSRGAVRPLCRIASSTPEEGSLSALAALSVMCGHAREWGNQCAEDLVDAGGIGRMVEIALSGRPPLPKLAPSEKEKTAMGEWRRGVNYACALMANATRTERGAVAFLGKAFPEEAVPSATVSTPDSDENEGESAVEKATSTIGEAEGEPQVALLLSRFADPSMIDAERAALLAERRRKKKDEYDSDLEDEDEVENDAAEDAEGADKADIVGGEHYDPYQHIAAVIMNVTQLETGRKFLMKIKESPTYTSSGGKEGTSTSLLQTLLPQLESPNVNRRRGIAGTIKNCCFEQESSWWLINIVHIDKSILYNLAGPEELDVDEKVGLDPDLWLEGPSKVREPDSFTRLYVVEALLLLLTSGRAARETLRGRRSFMIVKMADMVEENEDVSERFEECVQYLRRDEEGDREGDSDARAYEKWKALPAPSASEAVGNTGADADFDEVD